jgi:hypothetical protein
MRSSLLRVACERKLKKDRLFGGGASNMGTWFLWAISICKIIIEVNLKLYSAWWLVPRFSIDLHWKLFLSSYHNMWALSKTFSGRTQSCPDLSWWKKNVVDHLVKVSVTWPICKQTWTAWKFTIFLHFLSAEFGLWIPPHIGSSMRGWNVEKCYTLKLRYSS